MNAAGMYQEETRSYLTCFVIYAKKRFSFLREKPIFA